MRALRFAAKLSEMPNELNNFTNINAKIDTKSMDAIVNNSHLLRKISKERITQELIKIAKM
jgi:tRNA nucleotidyltransferase/poly(A) polymerase